MTSCLFCKIVEKTIPATIVAENDHALAFRDLHPAAPTHVLVVPKTHLASIDEAADESAIVAQVMKLARDVARAEGHQASGYRLVMNTGDNAGQSVHHWHVHVLGGRQMSWPPG